MRLLVAGIVLLVSFPSFVTAQPGGIEIEPTASAGVRYEVDFNNNDFPDDGTAEHGLRLKASLGAEVTVNSWLRFVVRARAHRTQENDSRDSHIDATSIASSPESIAVDRGYLRLEPPAIRGLRVDVGMVEHPTGSGPALWDRDISATGAALSYRRHLGALNLTLEPSAFAYYTDRVSAGRGGVVGGELQVTSQLSEFEVGVSAGIIDFYRQQALVTPDSDNSLLFGNGSLEFAEKFQIVELRGRVRVHQLLYLPLEVFGSIIENTEATRQGRGYTAGAFTSRRTLGGLVTASYRYRWIDQDSVMSVLASDDYLFNTNVRGNDIELRYNGDGFEVAAIAFGYSRRFDPSGGAAGLDLGRRYRVRFDFSASF